MHEIWDCPADKWEFLSPQFLHVCSSSGCTARVIIWSRHMHRLQFPPREWTGSSLGPRVCCGTSDLPGLLTPAPHAPHSWMAGALPTVGRTAKGQLCHFPQLLFRLMEKAEHSWVSSLVWPTSITHKSLIGHPKSCHLGLLGLLCFLTLYLLPPRLQELRVSFFKTFFCSSQFEQVAVPCSAAVSARLHLQI